MLPVSDEWLMTIATSSILAEKRFLTVGEKLDELPSAENTWAKLKNHFIDAQATIERATQASGGSFGSANSAVLLV